MFNFCQETSLLKSFEDKNLPIYITLDYMEWTAAASGLRYSTCITEIPDKVKNTRQGQHYHQRLEAQLRYYWLPRMLTLSQKAEGWPFCSWFMCKVVESQSVCGCLGVTLRDTASGAFFLMFQHVGSCLRRWRYNPARQTVATSTWSFHKWTGCKGRSGMHLFDSIITVQPLLTTCSYYMYKW